MEEQNHNDFSSQSTPQEGELKVIEAQGSPPLNGLIADSA